MNFFRFYITLIFTVKILFVNGQENAFVQSKALDLPQRGWNKVLCMKNGNTLLFHMEPQKDIAIKVFDSTHKLVAESKDSYRYLDVFNIEDAKFKGLIEVNNEAVMFFEQDRFGKHTLIRERYNGSTGKLIEDIIIGKSQSVMKKNQFFVIKNRNDSNYAILFATDNTEFKESDLHVAYYNKLHELLKDIKLDIDRKKYSFLTVLSAESLPNGILITLGLDKEIIYGHPTHGSALVEVGSSYQHNISHHYIPKNASVAYQNTIDISTGYFPYYSFYTYNEFANSINSLIFSYKPVFSQFGLNYTYGTIQSNLFFKISESDMSIETSIIGNKYANDNLKQVTDTNHYFEGIPSRLFTNENGLSTLIMQSYIAYGEFENRIKFAKQDYFGNICVTQFGDNGNEIWGVVLPLTQYHKSYKHYYPLKEVAKRSQEQTIFDDYPPEVYNRQFISTNQYCYKGNYYVIYNDYDKNFGNSLKNPGDTVFNFDITNACYYKIDKKQKVSKNYLYGNSIKGNYRCSFIEGADFDEKTRYLCLNDPK